MTKIKDQIFFFRNISSTLSCVENCQKCLFSYGLNVISFWDFKRFRLKDFLIYLLPLQFKLDILSEKFHKAALLEFQSFVGNYKNL